ncbi:hypothetical protein B0A48_07897 [Cryoendolithus antarcticus]|uniref:Nephrocystin 3-like N-terminal domain-containing protein n=1 Tax=Cryoendolithus antarcticus TaxID=1507870 RepID=A0A1V8T0M4_9PEZI|nr:hypothetical protein B0A48_07897 [Cryoendolithus antarcticus]
MSQQPSGGGYHVNNLNAADHAQVHVGDVHNYHEATNSELRDKIVRWLDAPSSASSHETARSRFTPGTGRWLLDSSAYEDWHSGKTPVVWINGKSGCCKTILCSTIIDDVYKRVKDRDDSSFAYFYLTFSDDKRQSYQALLISLVYQLLECQNEANVDIPKDLQSAYEKRYRSTEILEGALLTLLRQRNISYIVIDALDECPENDDVRSRLLQGLTTLSMMDHETVFEIPIKDRAVNDDVATYIADQITRDAKLARMDAIVGGNVQRVLNESAGGMFRWHVEDALYDLPRTLDETYSRILLAFDDSVRHNVRRALEWLAFTKRPLRYAEFIETCITHPKTDPYLNEAERDTFPEIIDLLSSLIHIGEVESYVADIDGIGRTITLAHFSVKEYLVSDRIRVTDAKYFALSAPRAHYNLAQSCLAYLIYVLSLWTAAEIRADSLTIPQTVFPLLSLAANYWDEYQRQAESSLPPDEILGLQLVLLQDPELRDAWLRMPATAALLCQLEPSDMNADDQFVETPLVRACLAGEETIVTILINAGADIDRISNGLSPLLAASGRGHGHIVKLLIDRGADKHLTIEGRSALAHACRGDHLEVVKLLLHMCANHESRYRAIDGPLVTAAHLNHVDIAQLLISAGENVDGVGEGYAWETPLFAAASQGSAEVIQVLIAGGAEVDRISACGSTALHEACRRGNEGSSLVGSCGA